MTAGVIVSIPPLVEQPPGNNSSNPAGLPGVTYTAAVPILPQTWTGVQTFEPGTIVLNGSGGPSQVLKQSTPNGAVTVGQLSFADISGSIGPVQIPPPTPTTLGGVNSIVAAPHLFLTQIGTDGSVAHAQPAFTDISGSVAAAQMPALTGDVTTTAGAVATTLATVNGNVGTFGSATAVPQITTNGKGLITAVATVTITPAIGSVTGLGTGVATALGIAVGSAGGPVANGGALGTPSSGVATNLTGTASGLTAGHVTTNANLTGDVTSVGNATTLASGNAGNLNSGTLLAARLPALTGDVTSTAGSAATSIAANAVTNAKLAGMAAWTFKANFTSGTAGPTDVTIDGTTPKSSPAASDELWIWDVAGSAVKKTTVSALSSAGSVATIAGNTGAFTLSSGIKNVVNDIQADPVYHRSYLAGLTLSTAGSSSTFGVAAGLCVDSTNAAFMLLASAYTKTTGSWVVGSGNGALDVGTIAGSTWYHVYQIKRLDTGVVDLCVSTSASSPNLTTGNIPTAYILFRRIGSMKTDSSSHWTAFTQLGDEFLWAVPVGDAVSATVNLTSSLLTLSTPPGVQTNALCTGVVVDATPGPVLFTSPDQPDTAPGISQLTVYLVASTNMPYFLNMRTNALSQIRVRGSANGTQLWTTTNGYIDPRGKFI